MAEASNTTREEDGLSALEGRKVLLLVSGGIAAYKAPLIVRALQAEGALVRCALTQNATQFVTPLVLETLTQSPVATDMFGTGTRIEHLELARWAELVLVAPATAHLIARLAHGLADDLVSTLMLAVKAPVVLAPAMNCDMYEHQATQHNLSILKGFGYTIVDPDEGELACRVKGKGRMPDPEELLEALRSRLQPPVLEGKTVLVSAGASREFLDPVRFLSNPSSGKMGVALAKAAAQAGAQVTLFGGVGVQALPGVEFVPFEGVEQLRASLFSRLDEADWLWMAAALGDWQPAQLLASKRKKRFLEGQEDRWSIELRPTPDLLRLACERRREADLQRLHIVGFAAETHELENNAREKLARKGCDVILANWVRSAEGDSFGADETCLHAYVQEGLLKRYGPASKDALAQALIADFAEQAQHGWPPRAMM
ncbi:MAG: bifunctional phosphopantothenoylcysteine decarboxylase/phosphopantothenate--cysteine ligase CoaBC [Myxococcota bacterium]|jgi:phosphopantothenoylcysteine decarboxylase/phosphopantothenate--cysteine ligase|nr:bifunctional phosphopantothenoylcysteine decarboxylase/phosphopantothenate--cysteine ligase CoaBC [Myxococcota bacterium]